MLAYAGSVFCTAVALKRHEGVNAFSLVVCWITELASLSQHLENLNGFFAELSLRTAGGVLLTHLAYQCVYVSSFNALYALVAR